jgi:CBS domain containing-hemolysin-like protein
LSIILIPLVLYFLEALISGIAARNADSWIKYFHGIARLTVFFFKPLYSFYESFKPDNIRNDYTFNEVEAHLREWVNNAPDNAALKEDERKMVRSILHFSDTLIREIMIPRIDMTAVDVETSLEERHLSYWLRTFSFAGL